MGWAVGLGKGGWAYSSSPAPPFYRIHTCGWKLLGLVLTPDPFATGRLSEARNPATVRKQPMCNTCMY
eukprot:scaffold20524_cov90-Isochrysis_galbana.AAC.1